MTRKQNILIILICVLLSAVFPLGGCTKENGESTAPGNTAGHELLASWAYIHDPETEVLAFTTDGLAFYHGKQYTYSQEGDFLTLTDEDGKETTMRFIQAREGKMLLYERTEYHYAGISKPDGIIGYWTGGPEDRLSYEFTKKGTYLEDGTFPGHYSEDPENGTIKLMYNARLEDTLIYYSVDGDKLTIDYPWPMVKTEPAK
jgi:hypothetical protein